MGPRIRRHRDAVSPVVAEILLIAIAVVLAAIIYIMATGLLQGPGLSKPYVTFAAPTRISDGTSGLANYSVRVAEASQDYAYTSYKVNLVVNNVTTSAVPVRPTGQVAGLVIGGTAYRIVWADLGGGGMVNAGDTFTISGNNVPLPAGLHVLFYLIWSSDGSAVQSSEFHT